MIVSDPQIQDKFEDTMSYDNCEAVTLKFDPTFWGYQDLCEKDIVKYCTKRAIRYYLVAERGPGGNYHMHGIMVFPFEDARKRFQTWFNKQFGHFKVSTKSNAVGWFNYIMKGCPVQKEAGPDLMDGSGELQKPEVPFLFDPKYEA